MKPKLFPETASGDQLRIEFDYVEEQHAFEAVLRNLKEHIAQTPSQSFKFRTTLQYEVAREHESELREILGLNSLNIVNKNVVNIQAKTK